MLSIPATSSSSPLKKGILKIGFFLSILFSLSMVLSTNSFAQPTQGKTYKEFLPMGSGKSLALPEGNWEVMHTSSWTPGSTTWEIFTLKNLQPNPAVAYLVVRQTARPGRWGNTNCARKTASTYLHNEHGTIQSGLLNKCSRIFGFLNIAPLMDASFPNWSSADKDWWLPATPGLKDLSTYGNSSMFGAELEVQEFNGYRVRIEALIPPPKGFSLQKFRADMDAGISRPESEMLAMWNSIYIESIYKSYFEKKPQALMALSIPWMNNQGQPIAAATMVASAANTDTVKNNAGSVTAPVATPAVVQAPAPAVSAAPAAPAPTSPTAAEIAEKRRVEQERKQIEEEKVKMAQQLEAMRQMLAKLQKENEAAVKLAEAAKAQTESQAAAPAAPTSSKNVVYANRKALVIGNDLYTEVSPLKNAAADANAMAISLEQVGYKVYKHLNLDEKKFKQAIRDFRANVQGGDEVLVFYAGHGVQLGSANYLLPTDIKGEQEDQVKDEAILLQKILDDLEEKKTKFALAVIDACRDNPFKTKGRALGGRGLAPTSAATGQMVMFSAGSGQQALDRLGEKDTDKNGLFTRIFVKEMMKPGVSVDRVLRNVRNEVVRLAKSVGHEQTPALYDQAIGEFYFKQ